MSFRKNYIEIDQPDVELGDGEIKEHKMLPNSLYAPLITSEIDEEKIEGLNKASSIEESSIFNQTMSSTTSPSVHSQSLSSKIRESKQMVDKLDKAINYTKYIFHGARFVVLGLLLIPIGGSLKKMLTLSDQVDKYHQDQNTIFASFANTIEGNCAISVPNGTCWVATKTPNVESLYDMGECDASYKLNCNYAQPIYKNCTEIIGPSYNCKTPCCDLTQEFFGLPRPDFQQLSYNLIALSLSSGIVGLVICLEMLSMVLAKKRMMNFKEPQLFFSSLTQLSAFFSKEQIRALNNIAIKFDIHIEPKDIVATYQNFKVRYEQLARKLSLQEVSPLPKALTNLISEYDGEVLTPSLRL